MADPVPLTTTSYVVLGLVATMEPVTSYEMKRRVKGSIGYFWPFPHSQLYAEPARLSAAGLLDEDVEDGGRRRKSYRLTAIGRRALTRWLAEPTSEATEIRDLGLLKLFFGDETGPDERHALAGEQQRMHEARQAEYEAIRAAVHAVATRSQLATLDLGLRYEQAAAAFWAEQVAQSCSD